MTTGGVAAYCRVSTSGQDVSSQKEKVRDFAIKNGYDISKWFVDEAISGAEEERPQLLALKEWVLTNNGGKVIMSNVDRLARDFYIFAMYSRLFKENDVNPIYIATPQSGEPSMDNLIQMILGAFAEFEKNIIRERCIRGKRYKLNNGIAAGGGQAPYGYKFSGEIGEKKMVINEDEAEVVKKIFHLYTSDDYSIREIVKFLNKQNIKPGNRFKGFREVNNWSVSGVSYILINRVYLGEWVFGKILVTGGKKHQKQTRRDDDDPCLIKVKVPLIIDQHMFSMAQAKKESRGLKWGVSSENKRTYILKGLVKCGICKYHYCGVSGSLTKKNAYYRCSSYNHIVKDDKRGCGNLTFRAKEFEDMVLNYVGEIINSPEFLKKELNRNAGKKELNNIKERQKVLETKLKDIKQQRVRIVGDFATGLFSRNDVISFKNKLLKV